MVENPEIRKERQKYLELVQKLSTALKRIIIGQNEVIDKVVKCLFAVGQRGFYLDKEGKTQRFLGCGHALFEGPTGTGKTVLCNTLSILVRGEMQRVSCEPDHMPSDLIGYEMPLADGVERLFKGAVFCDILLVDEINRLPPKTQSALLEAMAEGQVTINRKTHRMGKVFFVMGTQNPSKFKGTVSLNPALSDRFMIKILMKETTIDQKVEIAEWTHKFDPETLKSITDVEEISQAREFFYDHALVKKPVLKYCAKLLRAFGHPEEFSLFEKERALAAKMKLKLFEQSPPLNDRVLLQLHGAAIIEAASHDRPHAEPADARAMAADIFRAKLMLTGPALNCLLTENGWQTESEIINHLIEEALGKVLPD